MTVDNNTTDESLKNFGEASVPLSLLVNNSDTSSSSDSDSSVSTPRAQGSGRPNFGPVPKVDDLLSRVKNFLATPATAAGVQVNCDPEVVRDSAQVLVRGSASPEEQAVEIDVTAGVFDVQGDSSAVEEQMRKKNVPVVAAGKDEEELIQEVSNH
ncbi:hypothetical protein FOL47_004389 [Perkinsus chesapeaki]|uniref:Uncharacterized protein n=1 Tax=Perkinsus chesapeaki TaxID=330153 RepID=A0A7J6N0D1_PERCH|nr:hypothetical protein FOL47_004389 [Perkinsus chesapeaki]